MNRETLAKKFQIWLTKQNSVPNLEEAYLVGYREALNNPDQEEVTRLLSAFVSASNLNRAEAMGKLEVAIQRVCAKANDETKPKE